ncbi:isopentenyl-diphosphate Delta-isomerase [Ruminococcus sp.]|uniref:isopentenyl-diphosphate Delta-isomerase n=1 Tax=Ruminococcus sp. TaxID=41978 RepID=UPI00287309D1|nr:isopentenyl-diphosphate Delta-isomerase [Ruminococcus sp.]
MNPLILTDLFDNEIGTMSKSEAHRLGRLHRAFSVFIVDGGKMLIQKRHRDKYHSGGLWANACCSHPVQGETLAQAVPRRLKEELGIQCTARELFSFVYFTKYAPDLFEYEYDHVFLAEYSGTCDFDRDEIEELQWISFGELEQRMLERPQDFASWFMIAAPKVLCLLQQEKNSRDDRG